MIFRNGCSRDENGMSPPEISRPRPVPWISRGQLLLFFVVLAFPFFVVLDVSSVWDANEAFYVQTPREMLERGDWLVPYFNGQPRLNKPPLSYWLVGGLYQALGVALIWERLWLALLGFGSVLLVYAIGREIFEERPAALLAAGICATTFRLLMLSRRLLIDVLLLFCLLAAFYFFLRWLRRGTTPQLVLASAFLGLAFLAKGPVAALLPAVAGLYLIVVPNRPPLKVRGIACSALVFGLIAGSWYLALGLRLGWEPVIDFFLKENVGRFSHLEYGPTRGVFYYSGVFLSDFFPWSIFFVAAVAGSARRVFSRRSEERSGPWGQHSALLLLLVAAYLLFFSFSQNKQEYYIMPAYPAAALWMAPLLLHRPPPRWLHIGAGLSLLVAAVLLYLFATTIFPGAGGLWLPLLALPLLGFAFLAGRMQTAALGLALWFGLAFASYLPPFERYKPVPAFAEVIRERAAAAPDRALEAGYFNFTAPSLAFYLQDPIFELYDEKSAISRLRSSSLVLMIVRAEDYDRLCAKLGQPPEIVASRPKFYTTARLFVEGLKSGRTDDNRWARPVYLISNQGFGKEISRDLHRDSRLQ
jgi:4-amino-4-deoxy-L-arabinose transferase-like glycosyltransferase